MSLTYSSDQNRQGTTNRSERTTLSYELHDGVLTNVATAQ